MRNKYFYLPVLFILLSQCRDKKVDVIDNSVIDSDLIISVSESSANGISEEEKEIYLSAKTKAGYPCGNRSIESEHLSYKYQLLIDYKKIITPTYCTLSGGPASSQIRLGALQNGEYKLELKSPQWSNNGILKVDSTQITLVFKNPDGIEIPEPVFKRSR